MLRAQQKKLPRIGILTPAASDQTVIFAALRKGFADLGYIDGKTMVLDYRFAKGDTAVLAKLARELVDANVRLAPESGLAPVIPPRPCQPGFPTGCRPA